MCDTDKPQLADCLDYGNVEIYFQAVSLDDKMSGPTMSMTSQVRTLPERILIIGDSFVEGVGGTDGGWAQDFARGAADSEVVTSGIGGDNTEDLLSRYRAHLSFEPQLTVVQIGLNDSRYRPSRNGNEISPEQFRSNLISLVRAFRDVPSMVMLVGLTTVDESLADPYKEDKHYKNAQIAKFDEIVRQVAADLEAHYVAGPDLAGGDDLLSDGLHPNDNGHAIILHEVLAAISER